MGSIIQTLTLAMVLLIVGLSCVVIGVAGLALLARRDRRKAEKENAERTAGITHGVRSALPFQQALSGFRALTDRGRGQHSPATRIQLGQPLLLVLDSGAKLALVFQEAGKDDHHAALNNHSEPVG